VAKKLKEFEEHKGNFEQERVELAKQLELIKKES
jgi:hypothetical protein